MPLLRWIARSVWDWPRGQEGRGLWCSQACLHRSLTDFSPGTSTASLAAEGDTDGILGAPTWRVVMPSLRTAFTLHLGLCSQVHHPHTDSRLCLQVASGQPLKDSLDLPKGMAQNNWASNQPLALFSKVWLWQKARRFCGKGGKKSRETVAGGRGPECVCSCWPSNFNSINMTEFQLLKKRAFDDILT